jgi:hypothetical protein
MNPARMLTESLTPGPELENEIGTMLPQVSPIAAPKAVQGAGKCGTSRQGAGISPAEPPRPTAGERCGLVGTNQGNGE